MTVDAAAGTPKRGSYKKSARVRDEIVDAATNVFATRGYHGGSLRDIARQLDIAPTSLIHHFGSKEGLLEAVLQNANRAAEPWYYDRMESRGVKRAVLELIAFNYSRPELLRLLAILSSEASHPDHPAHAWFVERYEVLVTAMSTYIRQDIDAGRVSAAVDPETVARSIIGLWDGLQLQWLLNPEIDMTRLMTSALDRHLPVGTGGAHW